MSAGMNEVIATGGGYVDFDPVNHLKHLRAKIGYRAGFYIAMTVADMKRLDEVIAFNSGGDNAPKKESL